MTQQMTERFDAWVNALHSEVSIALLNDKDNRQERKKRLLLVRSPYRRVAAQLVHQVVRLNPPAFGAVLTGPYKRRGFDVLGFGAESTAIRPSVNDESVTKVLRSTVHMDAVGQNHRVDQLALGQVPVLDRFGDMAVAQRFDVIEHPLDSTRSVVAAHQPFIHDFDPVLIHNDDALAQLDLKHRQELLQFTTDALEMADSAGSIPDLIGAGNIGFGGSDRNLVLLDTLPINKGREILFGLSQQYAESIAAAVTATRHIT